MRRERRAVVKARFLAQEEAIEILVRGDPHFLGDKTIDRIRLVIVASHQRIEDPAHACCAVALQNEDIECVEGRGVRVRSAAARLRDHLAALWRLRIDVSEVWKIGAEGEITEDREAVRFRSTSVGRSVGDRRQRAKGSEADGANDTRAEMQNRTAGKKRARTRIQKSPL